MTDIILKVHFIQAKEKHHCLLYSGQGKTSLFAYNINALDIRLVIKKYNDYEMYHINGLTK